MPVQSSLHKIIQKVMVREDSWIARIVRQEILTQGYQQYPQSCTQLSTRMRREVWESTGI